MLARRRIWSSTSRVWVCGPSCVNWADTRREAVQAYDCTKCVDTTDHMTLAHEEVTNIAYVMLRTTRHSDGLPHSARNQSTKFAEKPEWQAF